MNHRSAGTPTERAIVVSPIYLRLLADIMEQAEFQKAEFFNFTDWLNEIKDYVNHRDDLAGLGVKRIFSCYAALLREEIRLLNAGPPLLAVISSRRFLIVSRDGETGIKCRSCGRTSWNKNDVDRKYCGFCHEFLNQKDAGGKA